MAVWVKLWNFVFCCKKTNDRFGRMRVPKRPFVFFLQRNTKFQSWTQTAIRFFSGKYKLFKTVPKQPFIFFQRNKKNFENYTQTAIRFLQNFESFTQTSIRIFLKEIRNLTIYRQFSFVSHKGKKIYKYDFERSRFVFLQRKPKLETLLNFELHIIHTKGYKNIDYRKLVTSFYNGFLKPVVYCRKNRYVLIKTPAKTMNEKNCDDKQKRRRNYSSR